MELQTAGSGGQRRCRTERRCDRGAFVPHAARERHGHAGAPASPGGEFARTRMLRVTELSPTLTSAIVLGSLWWVASALAGAYAASEPRGRASEQKKRAGRRRETAGQISHGANVVAALTLAWGAVMQLEVSGPQVLAACVIIFVVVAGASVIVHRVSEGTKPSTTGAKQRAIAVIVGLAIVAALVIALTRLVLLPLVSA